MTALLLCAACASQNAGKADADSEAKKAPEPVKAVAPAPQPLTKAQQELAAGVASYEDGAYKQAAKQLQGALTLGLESGTEQAKAHKYLAFMHCVGKRQKQCRDEFGKAMAADPAFDLSPAEAGHPTWGPVFRKLKAAPKAAK
ncbi:TssQ family T6SS-associated lipoprotein [Azonexus sp. IMCC34839]|uniref:TssQ family T6SS-associated lipoprotein n=1 Tax=Azonexus sp. IMCC34839 TaxID=3133695 RepID=UPI0039997B98